MHEIGFGILEALTLVTAVTGICWLLAFGLRKRLAGQRPSWVRWGAELFVVVGLVLAGRVALADWQQVPTGSMEPTVRVGDYLLVNKLAYGPRLPFTNTALELGQPQRGDVVVFRYPLDVSIFYVKRLVGLPGDVVRFRAGVVSVNGQPFDVGWSRHRTAGPRTPASCSCTSRPPASSARSRSTPTGRAGTCRRRRGCPTSSTAAWSRRRPGRAPCRKAGS